MSNTFKVGDKVRCVRTGRNGLLTLGGEYVISTVSYDGTNVGVNGSRSADWYADRFVLAESTPPKPAPKATDFAVGSKVMVGDQSKYDGKWAGPMEVKATNANFVTCKHPAYALTGAFFPTELVAYQEPPRDYRISRNNQLAAASFKTPEEAAEAGRRNYNDGTEFDIVEVVTVSKHTVRKVLEARA
ncbi:hypothetical protein MAFF211491_21070 [Ralstonia solanacearum]|nr:hypothetical protein MAFF211491_21070 [Ralstonia solanacearum]BCM13097.1 hypothetical protein MAFF241648_22870 [Ralstonia solanacearum]